MEREPELVGLRRLYHGERRPEKVCRLDGEYTAEAFKKTLGEELAGLVG